MLWLISMLYRHLIFLNISCKFPKKTRPLIKWDWNNFVLSCYFWEIEYDNTIIQSILYNVNIYFNLLYILSRLLIKWDWNNFVLSWYFWEIEYDNTIIQSILYNLNITFNLSLTFFIVISTNSICTFEDC